MKDERWRDIVDEPAPHDGSPVWVWNAKQPDWGVQNKPSDGDWWSFESKNGSTWAPTHWRPLVVPEPPQTSQEKET